MDEKIRNFDLDSYKKAVKGMIATSDNAYRNRSWDSLYYDRHLRNYTKEEIERIIDSGTIKQQIRLSENYFYRDGFYRRICIHYATLLKYIGILIPNPSFGKSLSSSFVKKRYYNAVDYIERIDIPDFCTNIALKAIVAGAYYGVVIRQDKEKFAVLDLPAQYCVSNFKDELGNDIIDFDITYFNTIVDTVARDEALAAYPTVISNYYRRYKKGKEKSKWVTIPTNIGICFPFFDGRPLFLNVIPATIDYDEAVKTERERDLEEIKKIIVQKVPHLNDGGLLFEPEEAEVMHDGSVQMLKGNKNVSVLTTYTDVDAIVSKTGADTQSNNLEKMVNNVYYQGGVSGQLFASNSNLSLETSLKNDMALMMVLGHKLERFITNIVNAAFANNNINFKYSLLPITWYNDDKYADTAFKLASSGYSFILPALAMGLSQRDLINIKDLENDVLNLDEKLIPLATAFTQSGITGEGAGAPKKDPQEKNPKTAKNEEILDKGGSKN